MIRIKMSGFHELPLLGHSVDFTGSIPFMLTYNMQYDRYSETPPQHTSLGCSRLRSSGARLHKFLVSSVRP